MGPFLEQLPKFPVNFTLFKYVKSQISYGFLITKEPIFGVQILDLKDHFLASLSRTSQTENSVAVFKIGIHLSNPYLLVFPRDLS